MFFRKLDNQTLSYNLNKCNIIAKKDEFYYQLIDVIVELYKEWNQEISFTEIRDQCIDKFSKRIEWLKTDWNQQVFRRLFIATKLNHLNDKKEDDEVLYWPTQEGIDFQLKLLYPLTSEKKEVEDANGISTKKSNKNFLRKFVSEEALKKRGISSALVPDSSREPDYPSIAESAQPLVFNKFNKLLIRNDLLEEADISEGLIDYYDHVTFNLKDCQIDELVLTKFIEKKINKNKNNNVYFQIYKNALNIYDTSAVTVSSGYFNASDIGKNILKSSLTSNFNEDGMDYSILIYKKPGEIDGPLYYELEGTPVAEAEKDGEVEEDLPSKSDLLTKIDDLRALLENVSEKVDISNKIEKDELKIPKQAIENEESMDLLSSLLVEEEMKGEKIKRKIIAIDGSNVMRIRGSRATFSRLQIAIKYCLDMKYDKIYVICDANLRHKLDSTDQKIYAQMLKGSSDKIHIQQSPGGTIADLFILNMANNFHKGGHFVKVMSNDLFRDFIKEDSENYNPEISNLIFKENLLLKFMFIKDPDDNEIFFEDK